MILFCKEHLGPVVPTGDISHADVGEIGVQNVGPVAGGIHPSVNHRLGGGIALGDVLPGAAEGRTEVSDHLEGRAVGGTKVGEIPIVLHVLGLVPSHPGQLPVVGQGLQPILPADLIDQADDLLLVICNGGIYRGDVDYLPRIDQVEILNFGIGAFDLAQAHLVLRCDLPQRVSSRDGVGDGGSLEPQRPCLPLGAMS